MLFGVILSLGLVLVVVNIIVLHPVNGLDIHRNKRANKIIITTSNFGVGKNREGQEGVNAYDNLHKSTGSIVLERINEADDFVIKVPPKNDVSFVQKISVGISPRKMFLRQIISIKRMISSTFVPNMKVLPEGYWSYVYWNALQDLSTSCRSVLATQRVLEGIGVGREGATAISATLNFIVRDGAGMMAGLIFTAMKASHFRYNVKKWKLFADCIVDLGLTLELSSTLLPRQFFLPMICMASMCKSICGVAAGASGGAIQVYWADKGSDISEVNSKFGAQSTITGAIGLIFSAMFAQSISKTGNAHFVWLIYTILTIVHIFANIQCLKHIHLDYFNKDRMDIVSRHFLAICQRDDEEGRIESRGESKFEMKMLTPKEVSKKESLFFLSLKRGNSPIIFGASMDDLYTATLCSANDIVKQLDNRYIIKVSKAFNRRWIIIVAMDVQASEEDYLKAYFHGILLSTLLYAQKVEPSSTFDLIENKAAMICQNLWNEYKVLAIQAGWNLQKSALASHTERAYGLVIS